MTFCPVEVNVAYDVEPNLIGQKIPEIYSVFCVSRCYNVTLLPQVLFAWDAADSSNTILQLSLKGLSTQY